MSFRERLRRLLCSHIFCRTEVWLENTALPLVLVKSTCKRCGKDMPLPEPALSSEALPELLERVRKLPPGEKVQLQ